MSMAGSNKRRCQRIVILVAAIWLVTGIPLGVSFELASHNSAGFLFGTIIGAIILPPLFACLVLLCALPFVLVGGVGYLGYRQLRGGRRAEPHASAASDLPAAELSPAEVLRRRYIAGELTNEQFQSQMIDLLKGRFERGELDLHEYEYELGRFLEPERHLDPAAADPLDGLLPSADERPSRPH